MSGPDPDAPARGLLLDIGGVVLAAGPVLVNRLAETEERLARLLAPLGGIAGPGDELWQQMLGSEVSERDYWAVRGAEIVQALGIDGGERPTRSLMQVLYTGPSAGWLRAQTLDLMHDVRAAGLGLAALTNDMADFHGRAWVAEQEWVALFDSVVDGSLTGVLKPDPRAYGFAVEAMGLRPDQIVYLDDMPWNVEGGLAAGLRAVRMPHGDATATLAGVRVLLGLPPASGRAAVADGGTPDPLDVPA